MKYESITVHCRICGQFGTQWLNFWQTYWPVANYMEENNGLSNCPRKWLMTLLDQFVVALKKFVIRVQAWPRVCYNCQEEK